MVAEAHTIVMIVSYVGTGFSGFARQPQAETVQGRIESALETVLRREVVTVGAGRTDAGVHALGQVVSFEASGGDLDEHTLLRSLNALAGPDIVVSEVRRAPAGFSARFDAVAREYRYRIVTGPVPPVFLKPYAWWVKGHLDIGAMRRSANALLGEHDFASFCVTESARDKSTVRTLELIEITSERELGEHYVQFRFVGNAFLHSMIRAIVGTLVEVGVGRRPEEWVADALAACDRSSAGPTAPPEGLTLWHVTYPEECWL